MAEPASWTPGPARPDTFLPILLLLASTHCCGNVVPSTHCCGNVVPKSSSRIRGNWSHHVVAMCDQMCDRMCDPIAVAGGGVVIMQRVQDKEIFRPCRGTLHTPILLRLAKSRKAEEVRWRWGHAPPPPCVWQQYLMCGSLWTVAVGNIMKVTLTLGPKPHDCHRR